MPTALVTGINGFTGRHLVNELRQSGFAISGIGQQPSQFADVKFIECDLTNRNSAIEAVRLLRPDVVFHLAGIAFAANDDVETIYRTHILGTRNLLDALTLCRHKPTSVLLASSANIYGNAAVKFITETTPPAPANDYAVSKLAMEYMAYLWLDKLPIVIARPFNYTGRWQSTQFLIPKIVDHFRRKAAVIELGNLDVVRDFSDVRTVAYCYRRLVETAPSRGSGCEAFNTCSGIGISLHDVLQMMREISGHDLEVRVNPAFVRSNEVKTLIGTRAKLESAIGAVQDIPFYETLEWMYHAPVAA